MRGSFAFTVLAIGALAAGCASAVPPGLQRAAPLRAVPFAASTPAIAQLYAALKFDGKTFAVVPHPCKSLVFRSAPPFTAPHSGRLKLTTRVLVAATCVPSPLPSPLPSLLLVGVTIPQHHVRAVAGPASLKAHVWKFAPLSPELAIERGARYAFFIASLRTPSPSPSPPWQMFHGSATHNGYAAVNGPTVGTLKWKFQAGPGGLGNPPNSFAVSSAGIIYVGGPNALYALNAAGGIVWQKPESDPQGPALSNDQKTLYYSAVDSLVAVSATTGATLWTYATGNKVIFGPTVAPNDTILEGSFDTYLYDVNPDGTLNWRYQTQGDIAYPSSVDANGNVYLGGGDSHAGPDPYVYSFNSAGKLRWKYDTTTTQVGTPAVGSEGTLLVPAQPWLFGLDPSTGAVKWFSPKCGPPPLLPCGSSEATGVGSPAIGPDGTVYTVTDKGAVNITNPVTGATTQIYNTNNAIPSYPLVDKNGNVYVGDTSGNMYGISKTGALLWTYTTGGAISEASPALGPDGTLYFSSQDGYVYALSP